MARHAYDLSLYSIFFRRVFLIFFRQKTPFIIVFSTQIIYMREVLSDERRAFPTALRLILSEENLL